VIREVKVQIIDRGEADAEPAKHLEHIQRTEY
jgi:hypothetical protein